MSIFSQLFRRTTLLFSLLFLSTLASAQSVTLQGSLQNVLGTTYTSSSTAFVRVRLNNYQNNIPRVIGTSTLVGASTDIHPDSNGNISQNIYGNDEIAPFNTYYTLEFWSNGTVKVAANYLINFNGGSGAVFDFTANQPLSNTPAPASYFPVLLNPAGSQTIVQSAGTTFTIIGNMSVTGTFTASSLPSLAGNNTFTGNQIFTGNLQIPNTLGVVQCLYEDAVGNILGTGSACGAGGGGGGSGSVTSFSTDTSAVSALITSNVINSTTTPALSFAYANAGALTVWGNNGGSSGPPAYFNISALTLTESQITNLTSDLSSKAPTASPTFTGVATFSGTNGGFDGTEGSGAGVTAASGHDLLWPDSTGHCWKQNINNVAGGCLMDTSSTQAMTGKTFDTASNTLKYNGNTITGVSNPIMYFDGGAVLTWSPNMPAALTELAGSSNRRQQNDLTNFTQFRLILGVSTGNAATAALRVQYCVSTCGTPTNWNYLETSNGTTHSVNINTAGSPLTGTWVNIDAPAKTDTQIRVVGINGDGATAPTFTTIAVEFK